MWRKCLSCNGIRHTTNSQRRKHPVVRHRSATRSSSTVKLLTPMNRGLAGGDQRFERAHRLGDRVLPARPVQQIQVETIGAEHGKLC